MVIAKQKTGACVLSASSNCALVCAWLRRREESVRISMTEVIIDGYPIPTQIGQVAPR